MLLTRIFALFSFSVSVLAQYGLPTSPSTVTFTNTRRLLFDTDGNQLDAYGSKVQYFEGKYYLYGNSFSAQAAAYGIKSYSSIDLVNWHYEGYLFDPSTAICEDLGGCGRPHIVYNAQSKTYVLWLNSGSRGYVIATSSQAAGPYTFSPQRAMIDPQFNGLQPADFTVEVINNTGYIVFSALNFRDPRAGSIWPPIFQTMHISPLTSDYMNTTGVSYNVTSAAFDLIDQEAESPDLFYREGYYYVAASNTCGYCNGSIGLIYRAKSIEGPWQRNIIAGYSCDGQVEGVLPLKASTKDAATTYVWHSTSVPGGPRTAWGGHIFQPLRFNSDGSVQDLDCSSGASFTVPFTPGNGTTASAKTPTDSSPALAVYSPVCDSDQFTLYQTWTSSKAGSLKQVTVNIAASVQTANLSLTVFKFSSLDDLRSPEYKYTTLGAAIIPRASLHYTLDNAVVSLTNATVARGDKLGVAIAGVDFAPYCHLEYDLGKNDGSTVLLQQGQGQNSWRGLNGRTSPVYERVGKGVKFAAYVE